LHAKAKGAPKFRFYALYDKIYRKDVIAVAYRQCAANGGAPGIDGITFKAIEGYGVERWLGELSEVLKTKKYRPSAVRRVFIPKPDGKKRPLGIPTIMDRVVQTAAMLILGPIFEADLPPEQYAYRPNRSALDAIRHVHALLTSGHVQVVDADLSGYFDSIPHGELMKSLARRICDGALLHLLALWLKAPVVETDDRGGQHVSTPQKNAGRGTPQGAPISPLLANLYMRRFILGWAQLGYGDRLRARIVNYADDFVICCRNTGSAAMEIMRRLMQRLRLTVNETKTKCVDAWEESFDFLGYRIGPCYSAKTGKRYLGTRPSPKSMQALRSKIQTITRRSTTCLTIAVTVERLNCLLRGWANYFCLGPIWKAYRAVDGYVSERLRHWLCLQRKVRSRTRSRTPCDELHAKYGLVKLQAVARSHPWAKA